MHEHSLDESIIVTVDKKLMFILSFEHSDLQLK